LFLTSTPLQALGSLDSVPDQTPGLGKRAEPHADHKAQDEYPENLSFLFMATE
jgi:hypothetical protein